MQHFIAERELFFGGKKWILAVDGVDFHIDKDEIFGLVGESGCGKSTISFAIILADFIINRQHFKP